MRSQTKTLISSERQQSLGEEIANSVSSGLCLLAIIAGIPFLFRSAVQRGDRLSLAGAIVFAASMVTLYLTSTVYHALPQSRVKNLFLRFDQSAIFLFIAGSYTPFTLGALRGNLGWTLFGLVWASAIFGIALTLFGELQNRWFSTWVYVGIGWIGLFAARSVSQHIPLEMT
jgi:hemolysin III